MSLQDKSTALSRRDRSQIADAINAQLKTLCQDYAKSCNAKRPNLPLFQAIGELRRLRDRVLTGKTDAQLDDEASAAAEASERILFAEAR